MNNNDYKKPCCYFYIDANGKIAYVGKANGTLESRINAHSKEKKFIDCNCDFDIRYKIFEKTSDMDYAEVLFIKSLKPYLNVSCTTHGYFPNIDIDIHKFPVYVKSKMSNKQARIITKTKECSSRKELKQKYQEWYLELKNSIPEEFFNTVRFQVEGSLESYAYIPESIHADINVINHISKGDANGYIIHFSFYIGFMKYLIDYLKYRGLISITEFNHHEHVNVIEIKCKDANSIRSLCNNLLFITPAIYKYKTKDIDEKKALWNSECELAKLLCEIQKDISAFDKYL